MVVIHHVEQFYREANTCGVDTLGLITCPSCSSNLIIYLLCLELFIRVIILETLFKLVKVPYVPKKNITHAMGHKGDGDKPAINQDHHMETKHPQYISNI